MIHEQVSVFMDGELDAGDVDELVEALGDDGNLRQAWTRYHLIGDVLRGDNPVFGEARARPWIENAAPPATAAVIPWRSRVLKPAAGIAIAASVAAVTVAIALRSGSDPSPDLQIAQAPSTATHITPLVNSVKTSPNEPVIPTGIYDQRLNGYLVNFNEQRVLRGMPGVHPYVRIVGFKAE